VNVGFVRKRLRQALRIARQAERRPWSPAETASWIERFPQLAALLPPEEGEPLAEAFREEMKRLGLLA
jgi:hypothetical protein